MRKGLLKNLVALACAGTTVLASFALAGCKSVEAEENEGYLIIKEMGNIYKLHKASFSADASAKVYLEFKSQCGFKLMENSSATNGYIINPDKGIAFNVRDYAVYKNKEDIEPKLMEQVVHCEDCFGE